MSGTALIDTVGVTRVTTQIAPEGDRWMSRAVGGPMDGHMWAMDLAGEQAALHAAALDAVREAGGG